MQQQEKTEPFLSSGLQSGLILGKLFDLRQLILLCVHAAPLPASAAGSEAGVSASGDASPGRAGASMAEKRLCTPLMALRGGADSVLRLPERLVQVAPCGIAELRGAALRLLQGLAGALLRSERMRVLWDLASG
jgi:hypothetical protein